MTQGLDMGKRATGGMRCVQGERSQEERHPLLSVVVATYNPGPSLEETLESISGQTEHRIEILVIDGGSTDGTVDILRKREREIEYWISEADDGVYDAYNKGISLARGEWLSFLGAGDRFTDDRVVERLLHPPPTGKLVYGNVLWGDTGRIYDGRFSRHKLCRRNICHQAVVYHRDLFRLLGGFHPRYPVAADRAFHLLAFGTEGVHPEYRDLVVTRYRAGGISDTRKDPAFEAEKLELIRRHFGEGYYLLYRMYDAQKKILASIGSFLLGPFRG